MRFIVNEQHLLLEVEWQALLQLLASLVQILQKAVPLLLKLVALILALLAAPEIHEIARVLGWL